VLLLEGGGGRGSVMGMRGFIRVFCGVWGAWFEGGVFLFEAERRFLVFLG
jgi:hypothetical protein